MDDRIRLSVRRGFAYAQLGFLTVTYEVAKCSENRDPEAVAQALALRSMRELVGRDSDFVLDSHKGVPV